MTSYSKEVIRDLAAGTLPWPQTKRIMSAYKDDDRFFKYHRRAARTASAGRSRILLPVGDHLFIVPERQRAASPNANAAMTSATIGRTGSSRPHIIVRNTEEGAARDLSQQRHSRSGVDGNPRVHLPRLRHACTKSKPARRAIPIVHDFEPDLEGFYRDWLKQPLPKE